MPRHRAKLHAAWGGARLYALNHDAHGVRDVLCVARFQQPLEEAQLVPEPSAPDHKSVQPAPAFVVDRRIWNTTA
jgi:hypothetical protein